MMAIKFYRVEISICFIIQLISLTHKNEYQKRKEKYSWRMKVCRRSERRETMERFC
jgi:hypothetical protein